MRMKTLSFSISDVDKNHRPAPPLPSLPAVWTTCICYLDWDTLILAQPISYPEKKIDILLESELSGGEMCSILGTTHFTTFLQSHLYIYTHGAETHKNTL